MQMTEKLQPHISFRTQLVRFSTFCAQFIALEQKCWKTWKALSDFQSFHFHANKTILELFACYLQVESSFFYLQLTLNRLNYVILEFYGKLYISRLAIYYLK